MKGAASFVLASFRSSTGTRPPHHSAALTDLVLLIRRTVRPRGYASGFDSPAALLDDFFERLATQVVILSIFFFWTFGQATEMEASWIHMNERWNVDSF